MDAAGLHYVQRDNCFTWLEHPERVQQRMDRQLGSDRPVLLSEIARSLNPLHETALITARNASTQELTEMAA